MRRLLDVFAPESACQDGEASAMIRDEAVKRLGGRRNAGHVLIKPQRPAVARRGCLRTKDRFGSGVNGTVDIDELYSVFALITGQLRKSFGDARVLEGDILDAVTRDLTPT
jgi:hypothetical protein